MPTSTDNQDYGKKDQQNAQQGTGPAAGSQSGAAQEDRNNFSSDDQKGKKVDADPSKNEGQPADV